MELCTDLCVDAEDDLETFNRMDNGERFLNPPSNDIKMGKSISSEDYCKIMRSTNERQRALLLHAIDKLVDNKSKEPLQLFLGGPAGCGKTFTTKIIMETYNRFTNVSGNAYVACASTGKAAVALGGTTVHSALRIALGKAAPPLYGEALNEFRRGFRDVVLFVVDEVSMISAELMGFIDSRLKQIAGDMDTPFGGYDVFFIGDLRQLPPVRATPLYRQTFVGQWRSLKYHELPEVMRQKNWVFSTVLTKIGNGECLSNKEIEMIESRFISQEDAQVKYPDAVHLYDTNKDVADYNERSLRSSLAVELKAQDTFQGHDSPELLKCLQTKASDMTLNETGGLPPKIMLLLDKPYMVTINIDIADGIVNGAIGVLRHVEYEKNGRVKRVWLKFPEKDIGRNLQTQFRQYTKDRNIEKGCVPISQKSTAIHFKNNTRLLFRRIQLPLIAACALTIHKSQGGTFDEVVYEYDKRHHQQLVYVALSRVTSLEGLHLTNKRGDFKFHHGYRDRKNVELQNEFKRLEDKSLVTIQDEMSSFVKDEAFSITSLNIQNLHAHVKDLEADFVIPETKILMLSETWMSDDERIQISGYRLVNQFKRRSERAAGVAIYLKIGFGENAVSYDMHEYLDSIDDIGDICAVKCPLPNGETVLLVCVYISPGYRSDLAKIFVRRRLECYVNANLPIILCGDFNTDLMKNKIFLEDMKNDLNMEINSDPTINTTREGTAIDGVFTHCVNNLTTNPFVCYFSYHRPLLSVMS